MTDCNVAEAHQNAIDAHGTAKAGNRVQPFITMLVAERAFVSRFGISGVLGDYQRSSLA